MSSEIAAFFASFLHLPSNEDLILPNILYFAYLEDGSNETFFHPTRQFVAQNFQVVHPIYTFSFFATTFFRENETGFNFFRETFNCNC